MEMIDSGLATHVQNAVLECQFEGKPMNDIKLVDVQPIMREDLGQSVIEYRLIFVLKDPDGFADPFNHLLNKLAEWGVQDDYPYVTFVSVSQDKPGSKT